MIIRGDARTLPLIDACVDCIVTSPPYFGLRDYGTAGQIGLEPTPDAYVASLVQVFRELRRVLRDSGTVWLNLGDSYISVGAGTQGANGEMASRRVAQVRDRKAVHGTVERPPSVLGMAPKNLLGIPWRVAFALQADGWYLRSDIIWKKPNPMPESVTDRPTRSHEYLFLLAKAERYYYNSDAIREPYADDSLARVERGRSAMHKYADGGPGDQTLARDITQACTSPLGRNKRTVWTIPTMPYSGAHFATMPEALVEPCILAGCPLGGLVLDPFVGSGTVVAVAERLGRHGVGVDLAYQALAKARTAQRGLKFV